MTDNDNNQSAGAQTEEPVAADMKDSGAGDNSSVTEKQVKSPSKNNSKNGGGDAPAKEKDENVSDGEEDMEEEETPKKVSLFEGPVVVEGKRERKKTARLTEDIDKELKSLQEKRDKQSAIPEGKGTKLGDIPYVNHVITHKLQTDDLNLLHRLFFSVVGSSTGRRSNIKKFCGFDFEEGTPSYERKLDFLTRVYNKDMKKYILFPLGLKGEKTKEETAKVVLEYVMKPVDQKLEPPLSKKKKSEAKKRKQASKKSKGEKGTKKKKEKKEGENEEDAEVNDDSGSDSDEDKGSGSDADSDAEKEPPKKKVKKSTPKKTPSKTPKKTETPKNKKETKKKTPQKKSDKPKKKSSPKKDAKKPEDLSSLSSDSDSDDEPLTKKVKKSTPPTDDEVKDTVKRILDSSDLEDLSIRKVFQQVSEMYPDFDMSERQKFIKKTVKELIN